MTRGASRPAAAAAAVRPGTMTSPIARGPPQVAIVPSASSPASRSMTGPRAASTTDGAVAPGRATVPTAVIVSPW